MKKILACVVSAALSISACMMHVGAYYPYIPASSLHPVNLKGLLSDVCASDDVCASSGGGMYFWAPIPCTYDFVLKPEADADKIEDILNSCYSDDSCYSDEVSYYCDLLTDDSLQQVSHEGQRRYSVHDRTIKYAEHAELVMQEMLAQGMISEFYLCGEVKYLRTIQIGGYLSYYPVAGTAQILEQLTQYIESAGLEFTVDYYEFKEPENANYRYKGFYRAIPNTEMTEEELFVIAADIYEATGLRPYMNYFDDMAVDSEPYGHNALECPGDLNIDGASDVADAVLLSRVVAEDDTAPAVCDTGYLNADVDGDGLLTIMDVTALLDHIADIPAQS